MRVTVIGASTAGLFLAYLLAREMVEVEVYERERKLGSPERTLIVTSSLKDVLGFEPEETIINRIKYLELFSKTGWARLELKEPDLVIEREKLVKMLVRMAKGAGAKVRGGYQFEGFYPLQKRLFVSLREVGQGATKRIITDVLVGADGALSVVSQALSMNWHNFTALLQARVHLPVDMPGDTTRVWFDLDRTKYFYWMIPESERVASIGLVANGEHEASQRLEAFLRERRFEPFEYQAGVVPTRRRFEYRTDFPGYGHNIFFVGDAAAQVKVTTVGGVVTGLKGAKALAEALLNGRDYGRELRELRIELNLHFLLRLLLNKFRDEDYEELITLLKGRLKEVLEIHPRDELRKSVWRLVRAEPRLVRLGARALFRAMMRRER